MGQKTTNYNWDIFSQGKKPYWDEWVTLMGSIDTELYKRTKDLYMQGYNLYGSDQSEGDLHFYSTSHATKGKIYFGANAVYDELNDRLGVGLILPTAKLSLKGNAPISGSGNISTGGDSTTVTIPINDYPNIQVGTVLVNTNNQQTRYILKLLGSNQVKVDISVDWTGGVPYTYQLPLFQTIDNNWNILQFTAADGADATLDNTGAVLRFRYRNFHDVFNLGISSPTTGGVASERFGASAMGTATTVSYSTAVGYAALYKNNANFETAVGYVALSNNTTGYGNSAFGATALRQNTIGDYNLAVGLEALNSNISGSNNTAVGSYDTMLNNLTGSFNIAIGRAALSIGAAPEGNVVAGYAAGQHINGTGNVAIGYAAGGTTIGSGCVFLGYNSGTFETGSNKLFIDNTARANENDARIKALIYGIFDNSTDNQLLVFNAREVRFPYLPIYANNAAAVLGGLVAGDFYVTGADPDPVCVVH